MNERDNSLRKAAILIDSLGAQTAERLLGQMPSEEAALVRTAVLQLGPVGAAERDRIIREFMHTDLSTIAAPSDGVEMDHSLAEKIAAFEDPEQPVDCPTTESSRFVFLNDAPTDAVAEFLAQEHPQTASIVLAHLPPQRAADVLRLLPADRQAEVIGRLARMDETDPSVVGEVERELEKLVGCQNDRIEDRPAGLVAVEAILNAVGGNDRQVLLERLGQHDQQIVWQLGYPPQHGRHSTTTKIAVRRRSDRVRKDGSAEAASPAKTMGGTENEPCPPAKARAGNQTGGADGELAADAAPPIDFNDLIALDDVALAKVFRAADPQITLLALTGASRQLVDRILGRLPIREAKALRRQMEQLGPTRLSDMERAQRQLAELAGQMADQGEIIIPGTGRFTMAV